LELSIEIRDGVFEHRAMRGGLCTLEVCVRARPSQREGTPALLGCALVVRHGRSDARASACGFFLLGFN
jgi:hypothetical protein